MSQWNLLQPLWRRYSNRSRIANLTVRLNRHFANTWGEGCGQGKDHLRKRKVRHDAHVFGRHFERLIITTNQTQYNNRRWLALEDFQT